MHQRAGDEAQELGVMSVAEWPALISIRGYIGIVESMEAVDRKPNTGLEMKKPRNCRLFWRPDSAALYSPRLTGGKAYYYCC